jgi:tripartite-type tricarboxylate transporter receptor subunit TctC
MQKFFARVLMVLGLGLMAVFAHAQDYPQRPVKLLIPFPPGGPTDVLARLVAQKLTESMGQPFIVENRPGGTGTIASGAVSKAPADGYTLLVASTSSHISPYLLRNSAIDPVKDFTPVVNMATLPFYFVVNPQVPAQTLSEFIALAKQKPGAFNFASPGSGSGGHLCSEMFMRATGIRMTHIPYKGAAPAVQGLVAGETQFICDSISTSHPQVKAGRLRGLALTASRRFESAAEIPTTAESGLPDFQISLWFAVFGPPGLPAVITQRLNREINKVLDTSEVRARIAAIGGEYTPNSVEQFNGFLKTELPRWAQVIQDTGVKVD